jgi:hypothetical protein
MICGICLSGIISLTEACISSNREAVSKVPVIIIVWGLMIADKEHMVFDTIGIIPSL